MATMRALPFFALLMGGCASWEMIGITSTSTHNAHVQEAERFAHDAVKNQARLVEITHDLNQETIYLAKSQDDMAMLQRAVTTGGKIQHAKGVSEELVNREFSESPEPSGDWMGLILTAIGSLTGMSLTGLAVKSVMGAKLAQVAGEARRFAQSTEVNDTSHLKKYGV